MVSSLLLLSAACSNSASKELSHDDASQLVIDEVIQPDSLEQDLIAFGYPEPMQPGDVLEPYNFFGEDPAPGQTTFEAETWFFWIDDLPGGLFAHETRFVFVDRQSGDITVQKQEWWPVLNGQGLWLDNASYLDPENWLYSTLSMTAEETDRTGIKTRMVRFMRMTPPPQVLENPGQALIINASGVDERGAGDFILSGKQMAEKLQNAGFKTTYMGPESDPQPERVGQPFSDSTRTTQQPWYQWLEERAGQMQPGETLAVYITGHGAYQEGDSYIGGKQGIVVDRVLAQVLKKFNPGVDIIVITDSCKGGGFADALIDIADLTLTASSKNSSTSGDHDFTLSWINPLFTTDLNPFDEGNEFTSSLLEGWNQLSEDPAAIERIHQEAREGGFGFWPVFLAKAYEEGDAYNWASRFMFSSPIVQLGSEKTKAVVNLQGATGDLKSCSTGEPVGDAAPVQQDADHVWVSWENVGGEYVLRFNARFPGVETIDPPIWGGFEIYNPSRPVSEDHEGYIFNAVGNFQLGFLAGVTTFTPRLNEVNDAGHWQNIPNPPFSGFVHGNVISVDLPGYLVPPDGKFYFYTDDGSTCDSVGLDADGQPTGVIPAGGPLINLPTPNLDAPDVLPRTIFDLPANPIDCATGELVDDPGVDIRQVDLSNPSGDSLNIAVVLGDPGPARLDNFSFAVSLSLFSDAKNPVLYTQQFHAGEVTRSRQNPITGDLMESGAGFTMKEGTLFGTPVTTVSFELPIDELPAQIDGLNVFSFRAMNEGDPRHCDYTLGLFQPPLLTGTGSE
jgi:hypothetical protein